MIKNLAQLVEIAESSNNASAVRYEHAYVPSHLHVHIIERLHRCSESTAEVFAKMSWGYYQIMGDNLIGLGLRSDFFSYIGSSGVQRDFFMKFLLTNNILMSLSDFVTDKNMRMQFARVYNGPAEPEHYAEYLMGIFEASK